MRMVKVCWLLVTAYNRMERLARVHLASKRVHSAGFQMLAACLPGFHRFVRKLEAGIANRHFQHSALKRTIREKYDSRS